ncbi:MAG TPA: hypothetical protein VIM56_00515 [Rhizomicrobium sp.]
MAIQQFSIAHRQAIWTAHASKCFYCRQTLRWDDLNIDHIIPEHLSEKDQEREKLLTELRLPLKLDLRENWNLAPAHRVCNDRKGASVPHANQLILWLTQAKDKIEKIEFLTRKFKDESRSDVFRAKLETALAAGYLNEEQLRSALNRTRSGNATLSLTTGVEILDGPAIKELKRDEVDLLFDVPIQLGADLPEGLRLEGGPNGFCYVRTCREYQAAREQGYYGITTFDIKMEAFFIQTLGFLRGVQAARPAISSYIHAPRIGLCDLARIPSSLLVSFGPENPENDKILRENETLQQLINTGNGKLLAVGSDYFDFNFRGAITYARELFRADLDGDGVEDLMVSRYCRADGGSLGFGTDPIALSCLSDEALFRETLVVPLAAD